jgi:hypothetical protein
VPGTVMMRCDRAKCGQTAVLAGLEQRHYVAAIGVRHVVDIVCREDVSLDR